MKPVLPEISALPAGKVGYRNDQQAAFLEMARQRLQQLTQRGYVLEDMPDDNDVETPLGERLVLKCTDVYFDWRGFGTGKFGAFDTQTLRAASGKRLQ